jgi:kynurenine formamidase
LPVRVLDLTQPLGPETVVWPGAPTPSFREHESYECDGAFSRVVSLFEHSGTHLDAPAHFVRGAATVDQIPAEQLVCPLAVVDVRGRVADHADYRLAVADLERNELLHGPIESGSAVVVHTGWGRHSADAAAYLGRTGDGLFHFPGVGQPAADWLVEERRVSGIGIDGPGIDPGVDTAFEVHAKVTLPRGIWHLEGLVNLDRLPARGATLFVGALPFTGGSGAPARVIAANLDPERGEVMSARPVYRITTFVPPDHVDAVLEGVEREVPLVFGPYDRSAWWSAVGIEQFRPLAGSTPTVGKPGQVERVASVRLEFAIPRRPALLERVLTRGVLSNHPWEEPAVFVDESLVTATNLAGPDSLSAG